jgi:chorismate dehydratase
MIFAKIDYINLLPFHIYFKKNIKPAKLKAIINSKKSYPSDINKKFKNRKVDAAFISSIKSKGQKSLDFGIIGKREILSVLSIPGAYEEDQESNTSNMLAKILECEGKVLIGDKALKYYVSHDKDSFVDLGKLWTKKYNLPFVFARLCYNKHGDYLKRVTKNFNKNAVKIPQYILKEYSQRTGISVNDIQFYLTKLDYKINKKEKKGLNLFFKLAKDIK